MKTKKESIWNQIEDRIMIVLYFIGNTMNCALSLWVISFVIWLVGSFILSKIWIWNLIIIRSIFVGGMILGLIYAAITHMEFFDEGGMF